MKICQLTRPHKTRRDTFQRYQSRKTLRRFLGCESLEQRVVLTSYIVDTLDDVVADDGFVSLREAITAANNNAAFSDVPAGDAGPGVVDSITFAPALAGSVIELSAPLELSDAISISNTSDVPVIIDGNSQQILNVAAGTTDVTLDNLVLRGGEATNGGGIFVGNTASVTLNDLVLQANQATDGGGIYNDGGNILIVNSVFTSNFAVGASASGGAIFSVNGNVSLVNSQLTFNQATRAGGGIEIIDGSLTLQGSNLISNEVGVGGVASPGNGGGIHVSGIATVDITGGLILRNKAASEGGGLWNQAGSTMTVNNVRLLRNEARGDDATDGGGAIFNNGGTVEISNATISNNIADGSSGSGGGLLNLDGMLTVSNTLIAGNESNRAGGGIEATAASTTMLTNVTLDGNVTGVVAAPGNGGAFHITGAGNATIVGGSVVNNIAALEGGGLWNGSGLMTVEGTLIDANVANGSALDDGGGGVFNNGGTVEISNATISNNVADGELGSGGGVFNFGGSLTVSNTTISGNESNRAGGGIEATAASTTALTNVTLDGNVTGVVAAPGNGGGLHITGAGNATIIGGSVVNNLAALEGGGLWNGSGLMTVDGTFIDSNVANGAGADDGGGGLFNNGGTLEILNATISNNIADGLSGSGGGLLSLSGDVTIDSSIWIANGANRAGGAIEVIDGTLEINASDFVANDVGGLAGAANPGNGGAIHTSGNNAVTITGGTFNGNIAGREGGGVWIQNAGSLLATDVTFIGNIANGAALDDGGGAVFNNGGVITLVSPTMTGNTALGASGSGGAILNLGGSVTVDSGFISGNSASRAGGGIEDNAGQLALIDVSLTGNVTGSAPGNGGGLHITGASTVNINGGDVSSNVAANEGGGLWNSDTGTLNLTNVTIDQNTALVGGGVFNDGTSGDINIDSSTISFNTALAAGGGLASEGGVVSIVNSTVSANGAASDGGGLMIMDGAIDLTSATIALNTALNGGGIEVAGGTLTAVNSIVAENVATMGTDVRGSLTSNGNNLIGNTADTMITGPATGDIYDTLALLGPLQDNGGGTWTHELLVGSPALNAGSASVPAVDQRGVSRPQGAASDIGAFELETGGGAGLARLLNADVNRDGLVSVLDVLHVINELNQRGVRRQVGSSLDVNQDGVVTPLDALLVINVINEHGNAAIRIPAMNEVPPTTETTDEAQLTARAEAVRSSFMANLSALESRAQAFARRDLAFVDLEDEMLDALARHISRRELRSAS